MKTTKIAAFAIASIVVAPLPGCADVDAPEMVEDVGEAENALSTSWSSGPSLSVARSQHTVTLLSDGRVLIAGGMNNGSAVASVAICNASGTSCLPTNPMSQPRYDHIAMLLSNRKVLVAGGNGGSGAITNAEVYDPELGTWQPVASMKKPRSQHAAALLRGDTHDQVLVTGGVNASGATVATAEVFDPNANTWTLEGSMTSPRKLHETIRLSNGKVLVAGGNYNNGQLASAELYDPVAGTFSMASPMGALRSNHSLTLLKNGKVLAAGGANSKTAELYDPTLNQWSATGSMSTARKLHASVMAPDGRVMVIGGANNTSAALSGVELYDPSVGTWSGMPALATARSHVQALLLANGNVMVIGGHNGTSSLPSTELFDLGTAVPEDGVSSFFRANDGTSMPPISYERGVGTIPNVCPAGQELDGALCYPICNPGYYGVGPVCWETCPSGWADTGVFCEPTVSANTSDCPWYDVCGIALAAGCSTCPQGATNLGCTCRFPGATFRKASEPRGVGTVPTCAPALEYDAALCYAPCDPGYSGAGPVCWLDQISGADLCALFYDPTLASLAENTNQTMNYGFGVGVAAGVSASVETGVVYGRDGEYGCYVSTCIGVVNEASIDAWGSFGFSPLGFDAASGESIVTFIGVSYEFVGGSVGLVTDSEGNYAGMSTSVSLGIGGSPGSFGQQACTTSVTQVW